MKRPERILVLGAGAVGLSLAARLSRVAEVVAVTRENAARAISRDGLELTGAWGSGTFRFSCASGVPEGPAFDYVLITSKSQDTEEICREYRDQIAGCETVSFQNGIGNEEMIARVTDRVIGGVVMTGFVREGERQVRVTATAGPWQIGRYPQGTDEPVRNLAGIMTRAGIVTEAADHVQGKIWSKNLINCSLNPLSAITGVTYGRLKEPDSWHIIDQIVRETYAVAKARGIPLQWGDPDAYLGYLFGALIPVMQRHTSSMLQDIQHGHKTEIDYLNGAVVAEGERLSIPTPYNACICDLIRFREFTGVPARP